MISYGMWRRRLKDPGAAGSRRRQVWAQSVKKARTCLRSLAEGDTDSRDLKAVIEEVLAPEYKGRVIVELLQNAHDAHPAKAGVGRVEILLDETEGEHGVLYVANSGREVTRERFDALRRVAASPKRPDEGIGHKGVGFKSVRQPEAPEVYSVSRPGAKTFDGYGFRFARPSDFDRLAAEAAPDDPSAADKLRENLSALMLPVPVDEVPEPVRQLCRRGIVTVVRLPSKTPRPATRLPGSCANSPTTARPSSSSSTVWPRSWCPHPGPPPRSASSSGGG
ncbi:ATP-binding protein [Kitasatospora aburaviensis]